jgi:hypothetical protein
MEESMEAAVTATKLCGAIEVKEDQIRSHFSVVSMVFRTASVSTHPWRLHLHRFGRSAVGIGLGEGLRVC